MNLKRIMTVLVLGLTFATAAIADLAPPKGYTKVSVGVTLETPDDLTDFRFFLVSSNLVKEIVVKKGEKTSVGALGGGARYRSGKIVAIPRSVFTSFGDDPTGDRREALERSVAEGTISGAQILVTHTFTREVRDADAKSVVDESYRIEKTATGLNAVPVSPVDKPANTGFASADAHRSGFGLTTVVGGILATIASLSIGLLVFTKFIKKSA